MNIFFLTETESGCFKWRSGIPGKYLTQRGHTIQLLSDGAQVYEAPDAMVFFRAHFQEALKLVDWCRKRNVRVIFDTDDALDLVPKENPNYSPLQPRLPMYEFLLKEADLVTTTTEALASHLRRWNPNVAVLPNSVDPDEWNPRPRQGETRIGWSGSPTHFTDLPVALDAIRELQKRYPFQLVLQGMCQESSLEELHQVLCARWGKLYMDKPLGRSIKHLLAKLEGIRYEFHSSVPIGKHAQKVCDLALDIGIAPLLENPFNSNKSCIKYYEFAMSGAVTLASNVLPYSTEVPVTAKNNREGWKSKLEFLLNSDREKMLREQRDWVMSERNMQTNVELWERAYAGECIESREQTVDVNSAVPV
jgi:glycosyltransferase involved in cell wall biosynthesis